MEGTQGGLRLRASLQDDFEVIDHISVIVLDLSSPSSEAHLMLLSWLDAMKRRVGPRSP
jgi:hypothetical protein